MKLIQLNIWEGKLLKEVLEFLSDQKPDILCMQEVFSAQSDIKLPDMMFDSWQAIQDTTNLGNSFFAPTFTATYAGGKADFGNAILSRYELRNKSATFTHGSYNPDQTSGNYVPNTRLLQTCKVVTSSGSFSLANHHGHREADPLGNEISIEKMKLVKSKLEELSTPLIFAGDLNVQPESPAMRVFDGFLEDLTATHELPTTLSQFGKAKDVACDHILVSSNIKTNSFRVAEDLVSDHKALILDFDI